MTNSIWLQKFFNFLCHKLGAVLWDHLHWQTMSCKQETQSLNGRWCSGWRHRENFNPLRLRIHNEQEHLTIKWIAIQGLLTFRGLLLQFAWHAWQSRTVCSTSWSRLGHHTCSLARDFMWTIPGWFKYNSDKTAAWYFAGITTLVPQRIDAAVFNSELILFVEINFQLFWDIIFCWPTMQNAVHRPRENGIPTRGLMDLRHCDWCLFHLNEIHLISLDTPIILLFHDLSWQSRQCISIGMIPGSLVFFVILISWQLYSPMLQAGCCQHRNTTFRTKQQGERHVVCKQRKVPSKQVLMELSNAKHNCQSFFLDHGIVLTCRETAGCVCDWSLFSVIWDVTKLLPNHTMRHRQPTELVDPGHNGPTKVSQGAISSTSWRLLDKHLSRTRVHWTSTSDSVG